MSYFIYQLRLAPLYRNESNWTEHTREIISAHFNYLKENCDKGQVLLAGRTALSIEEVNNYGICIFKSESAREAEKFMDNDPAVINGVMLARLFPFSMALLNTKD